MLDFIAILMVINFTEGLGLISYAQQAKVMVVRNNTGSLMLQASNGIVVRPNDNHILSFPDISGWLKVGENNKIDLDSGSGALDYDLSDFNRIIITLNVFDDNGHAVLNIYDKIGQEFSLNLNLIDGGDNPVIEIFKSNGAYLIRASYFDMHSRTIQMVQGLSGSILTFEFEGVSSSDRCQLNVEGLYWYY